MKSIKSIIQEIIIEHNMEDEFIFARICEVWKNYFHPIMQKNIFIIKYKNKVLYMKATSPVWRQEFLLQINIVLKQFNQNLGENLIDKIIINL